MGQNFKIVSSKGKKAAKRGTVAKTSAKAARRGAAPDADAQPVQRGAADTGMQPVQRGAEADTGMQPIQRGAAANTSMQPVQRGAANTGAQPVQRGAANTGAQPTQRGAAVYTGAQPAQRGAAPNTGAQPAQRGTAPNTGAEPARRGTAPNAGKKSKKRKTAAITAFVILFILLVGVIALVVSLGYYVERLDTVFPNVYADGIKLSGMTLAEASRTLIDAGYESNADGVSATIIFPDESKYTITGNEVGFALNAEDAAKAAYEYGRGGKFFESELVYIRAYLNRTDLRDVSKGRFNAEHVRGIVAAHTKAFNDTLIDAYSDINSERIVIVKGVAFAAAVEDAVYDLTEKTLMKALAEQKHLTAEYTPGASDNVEIDLVMLYNRIRVDPVSSVYDPETFSATEASPGISFDMAAARAMLDRAEIGVEVVIPIFAVEPEVKKEDIEELLFRDVIAETTTNIAGTSNRLNNITLAAGFIDGLQMNSGDVFSFNETVGPRTADRGFREAGAYINGMTVQEIGGGICQTSSTLYSCVLHADFEVVERQPHMFTVSYLPLGSDATINWGTIDFKFRNSSDYPIRIEATINVRELTVRIIGTKLDDNYIKIFYTQISSTPYEVIEVEDESIEPGGRKVETEGSTGFVVDTYKQYFDADDNLLDQVLVGRSTYYVQHRRILIPVPPEEEETEEGEDGEDPEDGSETEPPDGSETEPPDGSETEPPDESGTTPGEQEPPAETDPPPTDPPPPDDPPQETDPPPESNRQEPGG